LCSPTISNDESSNLLVVLPTQSLNPTQFFVDFWKIFTASTNQEIMVHSSSLEAKSKSKAPKHQMLGVFLKMKFPVWDVLGINFSIGDRVLCPTVEFPFGRMGGG